MKEEQLSDGESADERCRQDRDDDRCRERTIEDLEMQITKEELDKEIGVITREVETKRLKLADKLRRNKKRREEYESVRGDCIVRQRLKDEISAERHRLGKLREEFLAC
jgi:hypothetical protein